MSRMGIYHSKIEIKITSQVYIGLYGQNGSGKTALVDAIELLRYVLCGRSVPKKFAELVNIEAHFATLSYEFRVESPKGFQTVLYKFDLNSYPDEEESNIHTISSYGKKATMRRYSGW